MVSLFSLPAAPALYSNSPCLPPLASVSSHNGVALAVDMAQWRDALLVASGGSDYRLNVYCVKKGELALLWREENAHNG